jgi:hypothetical protein
LTEFTSKFKVLYGGRGRVVDTSPYVQYTVKYNAVFAKPHVGAKIVGKIVNIILSPNQAQQQVILMSEVEGCNLACITRDVDRDRFQV